MSRPTSQTLTDAELRIMRVLWSRAEATNLEIVAAITAPPLARNTVMTTLGVLERKGYVTHRAEGRTFVYSALVAEEAVRGNALENVIRRFFDGSARQLVVKLLDAEYIAPSDRERIQALVDDLSDR
jgi:predicted transcriptional regulator